MSNFFISNLVTLGQIGYLPASGTIASLITLIFIYFFQTLITNLFFQAIFILFFVLLVLLFLVIAKKNFSCCDPSEIVIDEVVGCFIALFGINLNSKFAVVAFVLFRFFDITKIFGISKLERNFSWPVSILLDDIVAGIYANILVRIIKICFQ